LRVWGLGCFFFTRPGAGAPPPAPPRPGALAALKEALATRAYLRTVIDDLGAALGEGTEETNVANRRH
jgi:hypothetical protein